MSRTKLWITQISARSYLVIHWKWLGKDRSYAAIPDLYFHCKKIDAYIWQLSKGLVHLWYLEKKGQPYGLA
jgi:hypothetical protein